MATNEISTLTQEEREAFWRRWGMESGVAESRALGDREGVARHGNRTGEVPRLLIDDRHITPVAVHRLQDKRARHLRSLGGKHTGAVRAAPAGC